MFDYGFYVGVCICLRASIFEQWYINGHVIVIHEYGKIVVVSEAFDLDFVDGVAFSIRSHNNGT